MSDLHCGSSAASHAADLHGNGIGAEGTAWLAAVLPQGPSLADLGLHSNGIGDDPQLLRRQNMGRL